MLSCAEADAQALCSAVASCIAPAAPDVVFFPVKRRVRHHGERAGGCRAGVRGGDGRLCRGQRVRPTHGRAVLAVGSTPPGAPQLFPLSPASFPLALRPSGCCLMYPGPGPSSGPGPASSLLSGSSPWWRMGDHALLAEEEEEAGGSAVAPVMVPSVQRVPASPAHPGPAVRGALSRSSQNHPGTAGPGGRRDPGGLFQAGLLRTIFGKLGAAWWGWILAGLSRTCAPRSHQKPCPLQQVPPWGAAPVGGRRRAGPAVGTQGRAGASGAEPRPGRSAGLCLRRGPLLLSVSVSRWPRAPGTSSATASGEKREGVGSNDPAPQPWQPRPLLLVPLGNCSQILSHLEGAKSPIPCCVGVRGAQGAGCHECLASGVRVWLSWLSLGARRLSGCKASGSPPQHPAKPSAPPGERGSTAAVGNKSVVGNASATESASSCGKCICRGKCTRACLRSRLCRAGSGKPRRAFLLPRLWARLVPFGSSRCWFDPSAGQAGVSGCPWHGSRSSRSVGPRTHASANLGEMVKTELKGAKSQGM